MERKKGSCSIERKPGTEIELLFRYKLVNVFGEAAFQAEHGYLMNEGFTQSVHPHVVRGLIEVGFNLVRFQTPPSEQEKQRKPSSQKEKQRGEG